MITVEKKDGHNLKMSHVIHEAKNRQLDVFLFIPGELGLNANIMSEDEFYHNVIHGKRTYFSDVHHLPLVHSRLASRGNLPSGQYRLSLSLFAYQFAVALEETVHQLLDEKTERTTEELEEVASVSAGILKRLRRNVPSDEELLKYYQNIDNYLSWLQNSVSFRWSPTCQERKTTAKSKHCIWISVRQNPLTVYLIIITPSAQRLIQRACRTKCGCCDA